MKKSIVLLMLVYAFSACKRDYDKSKFGPEVIIVPEDFTVSGFTVNPSNSINLATQDVYFDCTMPQRAEFKIEIVGLLSGAEKTIRGTHEAIDQANSTWSGDSDNINLFRTGESCSIELSFHGASKKYYDTILITGENTYSNITLINSFEGITFDKNGPNAASYGNYFDGTDITQADIKTDNSLKTCQGIQSVSFDGIDANNSYYIGGMYFYPPGTFYSFQGYSPDSLYLNVYVYSYGDNSANLSISYSEDDNGDNVADLINDDNWVKEIPVEGSGWKLISVRLKDFNDNNPTVGNGILNLNKIVGFNANFNAKTPGTRARLNLDYLNVSYVKPFQP
jgi:hypothetical protein